MSNSVYTGINDLLIELCVTMRGSDDEDWVSENEYHEERCCCNKNLDMHWDLPGDPGVWLLLEGGPEYEYVQRMKNRIFKIKTKINTNKPYVCLHLSYWYSTNISRMKCN